MGAQLDARQRVSCRFELFFPLLVLAAAAAAQSQSAVAVDQTTPTDTRHLSADRAGWGDHATCVVNETSPQKKQTRECARESRPA